MRSVSHFHASLIYASSVVNKLEASLTDNARVFSYIRHVFIVQAIGLSGTFHLILGY
jgi:hypothetical protein